MSFAIDRDGHVLIDRTIGYSICIVQVKEKVCRRCRSLFFIAKSMLMRDVFAALLRYGEFASQFHLRPLAIPRLGSYTDPTWTDRGHTAH